MGKKLKNLWHNRRYLIILVILVLVGAGWICFLLDRHVYPVNLNDPNLEKRIAFVSLWIAIVGFSLAVAGTVIAVLQFQASQSRPDLCLWMNDVGQSTVAITSTREGFALILENRGRKVARYVKCEIRFLLPRLQPGIGRDGRIQFNTHFDKYLISFWDLSPRDHETVATFRGQDKFVCYDEDSQRIGVFWFRRDDLDSTRYKVRYGLRCEGMSRKEGVLWIEVPEEVAGR